MRKTLWTELFPFVSQLDPGATQKAGPMRRFHGCSILPAHGAGGRGFFHATFTILTVLVICLCCFSAMAQNSGTIQGTVADAQGALIAGATVQALDQEKGVVARDATTNSEGIFVLQPLQPGTYTIKVQAKGMKNLHRANVVLDNRQVLSLGELRLEIGSTTENVTVEAVTPLVEIGTADHSDVIDSKLVSETSLNGRDFQSLVRTLPGVVSNDNSDFRLAFNNTNSFHVNGLRGSDNNFFLDGAINTDVGANDGQFTQLSMDAVGEFKIQSNNFAAEYGRNPGVLLAVNTKSGTKQFHGTLYEFHREDNFDATPPTQTAKNYIRFNQYGGNIGGPIPLPNYKNKLFFFFNYEGTRGIRPGNTQFNSQVIAGLGRGYELPNPAVLTGDLTAKYSGGNQCIHGVAQTADCPAGQGDNGFLNGQVFVPKSLTYNSLGEIVNGTVICGTKANPCNIIPTNMLSSQAQAFANYFKQGYQPNAIPDPNTINPEGVAQKFFNPFNERYNFKKHQEVARIDWNINAKTNFFFRWVDDSQQEQYHNLFDFADYPILPEYRKKPGSSWSWNLVNVISPTTTNEFIFGYNHLTQVVDILPGTSKSTYDRTALGFTFQELYPLSNVDNRAPVLNNCCNGDFTGGSFHPSWHSEARMFTWTDNVTHVMGPHILKFGVFFDYNQAGQQPVWTDTTFLDFSTGPINPGDTGSYLGNVFTGYYYRAQQSNGVFFGAFRFHQLEFFGQDTWKVNKKLTLDYGLRWAYLGPTYTVQPFFQNYFDPNRYDPNNAVTLNQHGGNYLNAICSAALVVADPASTCPATGPYGNPFNGIVQEGHGIPPGFADHKYANFAPRFGFAYDVFGDGKTAIRGGAGIFYERIRQNVNSFDGLGNPPLSYTPTIFGQRIDDLNPGLVSGIRTPVDLNAFDKRGQIPTTYGYSLEVQRELPWRMGFTAGYTGNVARHLQYQYNLQALPVGTASVLTTPLVQGATYKGYGNVNFTKYDANSSFNALQLKLIRRFSNSLTLTADYTWSKCMDITDSDTPGADPGVPSANQGGPLTDPFHPHLDWAPCGWDRASVFNVNYVYSLPQFRSAGFLKYLVGGWQVSGITRFWSGTPINIYMGGCSSCYTGNAENYVNLVRPDRGTGSPYAAKNHFTWLNPGAFVAPPLGTVGDVRRNAFRGPGINNWDMSLFKNINFSESRYLQLRLETFNTFNHVQPSGVNNTFGAASAGQPTTTISNTGDVNAYRDPRNVQLGVKLYF
jgi:Carboxypeptidase regulatory-like domain/TonB-dependent Receptor Plug Domain